MRRSISAWMLAVVVTLGCQGDPGQAHDLRVEFDRARAAHARLEVAIQELAHRTETARQSPRPERAAAARALLEAQAGFDRAWDHSQRALAEFLGHALAVAPWSPETDEALAIIANDALGAAVMVRSLAADPGADLEVLAAAEATFSRAGRPVPQALAQALAAARASR